MRCPVLTAHVAVPDGAARPQRKVFHRSLSSSPCSRGIFSTLPQQSLSTLSTLLHTLSARPQHALSPLWDGRSGTDNVQRNHQMGGAASGWWSWRARPRRSRAPSTSPPAPATTSWCVIAPLRHVMVTLWSRCCVHPVVGHVGVACWTASEGEHGPVVCVM